MVMDTYVWRHPGMKLSGRMQIAIQFVMGLLEACLLTTVRAVHAWSILCIFLMVLYAYVFVCTVCSRQMGTEVAKISFGALRPHFLTRCMGVAWPQQVPDTTTQCLVGKLG